MLECYLYIPFSNFQKVFYNNNIFENKGITPNKSDILTFHNLPTNYIGDLLIFFHYFTMDSLIH